VKLLLFEVKHKIPWLSKFNVVKIERETERKIHIKHTYITHRLYVNINK